MKKLALITALELLSLTTLSANAASVASTFTVNATLTSACIFSTAPNNLNVAYTGLQNTAATTTGSFGVTCTNTLPYSLALGTTTGTVAGVNLTYTLALPTATGTGNGAAQNYNVTMNMPANQAGTCASATCAGTAQSHTLTMTY